MHIPPHKRCNLVFICVTSERTNPAPAEASSPPAWERRPNAVCSQAPISYQTQNTPASRCRPVLLLLGMQTHKLMWPFRPASPLYTWGGDSFLLFLSVLVVSLFFFFLGIHQARLTGGRGQQRVSQSAAARGRRGKRSFLSHSGQRLVTQRRFCAAEQTRQRRPQTKTPTQPLGPLPRGDEPTPRAGMETPCISNETPERGWRRLLAPDQNKYQWQKARVRGLVCGLPTDGFTALPPSLPLLRCRLYLPSVRPNASISCVIPEGTWQR